MALKLGFPLLNIVKGDENTTTVRANLISFRKIDTDGHEMRRRRKNKLIYEFFKCSMLGMREYIKLEI